MSDVTNPRADSDGIPTQWPPTYAFRVKDGLAMISSYVFLMTPFLATMQAVTRAFALPDRRPVFYVLTPLKAYEFLAAIGISGILAGCVGKYLWLICMSRFLDRASVGPLISYGIPRRISAFDRRLVVRFYRDAGPAFEARLRPGVSAARLFWYLPATFFTGALISLGAASFHLVTDEKRFWRNGIACCFLAVALGLLANWARRNSR